IPDIYYINGRYSQSSRFAINGRFGIFHRSASFLVDWVDFEDLQILANWMDFVT
ncbi:4899_t:CDS:1, partial [Funneliformis geosporum]